MFRKKNNAVCQFWETSAIPALLTPSDDLVDRVHELATIGFMEIEQAPYLSRETIRQNQLNRVFEIASQAKREIPLYAEKLAMVDLSEVDKFTWEEFQKIPLTSKVDLMNAYPDGCINPRFDPKDLFPTRSSGSSGLTLDIRVDAEAIAIDTVQGLRQVMMQSGNRYQKDQTIAHIYTVPWVLEEIHGSFLNHFISSVIPPHDIATILKDLKPNVMALYPSVLNSLLKYSNEWLHSDLKLIITHSEQSSRDERRRMQELLAVPILDEYSSEEATRIALELPCGHYHTCDDTVVVEILDPNTMQPQKKGELGIVVVTNLLNTAMPFIRYVQGDMAIAGEDTDCTVNWGTLDSIAGRVNDSFINQDGDLIPSGTLLDISYRMMFDLGVSLKRFELVQTSPQDINLYCLPSEYNQCQKLSSDLKSLLEVTMGHIINLSVESKNLSIDTGHNKLRPIRRTF